MLWLHLIGFFFNFRWFYFKKGNHVCLKENAVPIWHFFSTGAKMSWCRAVFFNGCRTVLFPFDRPCDEISMKIRTENFYGRLFSTRLVQSRPHHHLIQSLKIILFSSWYSWKIAELVFINNHSPTNFVDPIFKSPKYTKI